MEIDLLNQQYDSFWKEHSKETFVESLIQLNSLFQEGIISEKGGEQQLITPDYLLTWYSLKHDLLPENVTLNYQQLLKEKVVEIKQLYNEIQTEFAKTGFNGIVHQIISIVVPEEYPEWVKKVGSLIDSLFEVVSNVVEGAVKFTEGFADIAKYLPLIVIGALIFLAFTYVKKQA